MNWKIKLLMSILVIILLTNFFFPVRYVLGQMLGRGNSIFAKHYYSTKHGYFVAALGGFFLKDGTWEDIETEFKQYKHCHPTSPDTVLYRRFELKPWQFWDWLNYFYQPRWQLPYLQSTLMQSPSVEPPKSVCSD